MWQIATTQRVFARRDYAMDKNIDSNEKEKHENEAAVTVTSSVAHKFRIEQINVRSRCFHKPNEYFDPNKKREKYIVLYTG